MIVGGILGSLAGLLIVANPVANGLFSGTFVAWLNGFAIIANGLVMIFGDDDPFSHGAGHVEPNVMVDPGLVYDNGLVDWYGLDPGKKYLGAVSHNDATTILGLTLIAVSTE